MRKNIEKYVKKCAIYQRTKTYHHKFFDEFNKLSQFQKF